MVVIVVCQQAIYSVGPIKASNDKAQSAKKFSTPLSGKSSMIYAFSTLVRSAFCAFRGKLRLMTFKMSFEEKKICDQHADESEEMRKKERLHDTE